MASAVDISGSQLQVLAAAAYPANDVNSSQVQIEAAVAGPELINLSQLSLMVAAAGSFNDPAVRAWTFTLDNHNYYVLRLGTIETLVYDDHAKQWYTWASGDDNTWKAYNGCNWYGGSSWAYTNGSNIIVGDDGNGALYFLDPDQDTDDDAVYGSAVPVPFRREAYGQLPFRGYNRLPCFGVQIQGSIGAQTDTTLTDVDLLTSDDRGGTYQDAGEISIPPGDIYARLYWRSLGAMRVPGRIFKLVDYGALKRIDSMEMIDGTGK